MMIQVKTFIEIYKRNEFQRLINNVAAVESLALDQSKSSCVSWRLHRCRLQLLGWHNQVQLGMQVLQFDFCPFGCSTTLYTEC